MVTQQYGPQDKNDMVDYIDAIIDIINAKIIEINSQTTEEDVLAVDITFN